MSQDASLRNIANQGERVVLEFIARSTTKAHRKGEVVRGNGVVLQRTNKWPAPVLTVQLDDGRIVKTEYRNTMRQPTGTK